MTHQSERTRAESPAARPLSLDAFSSTDWLLLAATAATWGSSFLWIELALESFAPAFITLLRLALGASALAFFRRARAKVDRDDLPAVALLGFLWMAAPFLLFAIAQQWIDSSLAGMINGSVPIFAGLVAAAILRRPPPVKTIVGIAVGFLGVVIVSRPALQTSNSTALGVALVLLASIFYGIAINIAVPLQQRYGSLPVLLRAQVAALVLTAVPGIVGATHSSFNWTSLVAIIPLGVLGTGLAFVWMTTLVGRVGAARGSVTIYFVPVVAIVLGVMFRNEDVSTMSLAGTALVIAGAILASRNQASRT
ncbi:MAG TPA: DMT family transporter [Actinomycetota bacterium]|nr:DMT family transporter [Actinomycetota bacterium]